MSSHSPWEGQWAQQFEDYEALVRLSIEERNAKDFALLLKTLFSFRTRNIRLSYDAVLYPREFVFQVKIGLMTFTTSPCLNGIVYELAIDKVREALYYLLRAGKLNKLEKKRIRKCLDRTR